MCDAKYKEVDTKWFNNYESPEGSFEIRDSISDIRDSKFNIPIKQWVEGQQTDVLSGQLNVV